MKEIIRNAAVVGASVGIVIFTIVFAMSYNSSPTAKVNIDGECVAWVSLGDILERPSDWKIQKHITEQAE